MTTDGRTLIDMCGTERSRERQDKIMEVVDSDVGRYRRTLGGLLKISVKLVENLEI